MVHSTLQCNLLILSYVARLRIIDAAGLRHGASREQLVKQQIATQEWFQERVNNQAPNETLPSSEMVSGTVSLAQDLKNWPAITSPTAPPFPAYHKPLWKSAVDPKSGRTYYYDVATART